LAQAATQAIAAHGQQTEAFLQSEIKGLPQGEQADDEEERIGRECPLALSNFLNAISPKRRT
jgi:hypothetical protein